MDENNNMQQNSNMQPSQQDADMNVAPVSGANYASFGSRFVAAFIDGLLIGIPVNLVVAMAPDEMKGMLTGVGNLVSFAYFVYFTAAKGATVGKKAMGLRVQNMNTGANLTYVEAFLREVVGKLISMIALFLGYLWMLWDPNKQTWHDKIASSVVVKVK